MIGHHNKIIRTNYLYQTSESKLTKLFFSTVASMKLHSHTAILHLKKETTTTKSYPTMHVRQNNTINVVRIRAC